MTTASDETLSRQQIVDLVAEEHELSNAKAQRIVKGIFDTISEVSHWWIERCYNITLNNVELQFLCQTFHVSFTAK